MDWPRCRRKVPLLHAAQMDEEGLARFGEKQAQALRQKLAGYNGVKPTPCPAACGPNSPYQKSGFDFLCISPA
jgi:hypothetical protein